MITIVLGQNPAKAKFFDANGNDITDELHVQKVRIEQDANGPLTAVIELLPEKVVAMQPDLRATVAPKYQTGGAVKGRSFLVGNHGPELFEPKRNGKIIPRED